MKSLGQYHGGPIAFTTQTNKEVRTRALDAATTRPPRGLNLVQPRNCWLDCRVLVVDNRWEIGCLVRQLSVVGGFAFTVYFLGISVGKWLTVGTDERARHLFLANFLRKYRVSRSPRPKSSRWHNGCTMTTPVICRAFSDEGRNAKLQK
jgi:hypothetical protein